MMIQARMQKASYIMANLLRLPSQAKVLSTRHLFLYSSVHLYRPLRLLRGGMQGPLMRSQPRKRSQPYALSATSLSGLFLGRPPPPRYPHPFQGLLGQLHIQAREERLPDASSYPLLLPPLQPSPSRNTSSWGARNKRFLRASLLAKVGRPSDHGDPRGSGP